MSYPTTCGRMVCVWVSLVMVLAAAPAWAADGWKAGVARVKITPEAPMWMAGYGGRDHSAEGTTSDLWAKAIALEDASGHRAVLVTLDLVGIDRTLSQALCKRLEEKHKLARHQVALCTSHTHCGPVVGNCLGPMHYGLVDDKQKALINAYAGKLVGQLETLVGEALGKLAPAQLNWGSGKTDFAVNRRANPEAKVPELRSAGQLKGPVDHDVPVLAVKNAAGELQAVVFGYACHATVLSFYQWCADYPGYAQSELEKAHPGAVAMFWAGCGADQNPLPRRTVELAQQYGQQLAKAVDQVLAQQMTAVAPKLATTYAEVPVELAPLPSREQIEKDAQSADKFVVSRARWLLAQIDGGKPLSPTYPYPIETWRLGDELIWVALGGEVVVDFSLRLKSELGGVKTWVAGYSNDVMAYIPSRRVLTEGGYEGGGAMVYYGLPTVWAPTVEETIVAAVKRQAAALSNSVR